MDLKYLVFLMIGSFLYAVPPREIPKEYRKEFTMNGLVSISSHYIDNTPIPGVFLVYDFATVESLKEKAKLRELGYYGPTDDFLYSALDQYPIEGKKVGIIGSATPWYEAIVLAYGGKPVTIDYNKIISEHPEIRTMTVEEYDADPELFDVVFCISSFEHDGLGRYGDPINPQGDLMAMEKTKHMLNPGGLLFLAIPVGHDHIYWNAHRVYGRHRLPLLLAGWRTVATFGYRGETDLNTFTSGYHQPVFVLQLQ